MTGVSALKGDINKNGNKERMNEIAQKLKDEGMYLTPEKLSDEHSLNSVL